MCFAVDRLGFLPTAAAIVLVAVARPRRAVASGRSRSRIGAPLFVHLIFSKLLRVPLPPGLLPMPW